MDYGYTRIFMDYMLVMEKFEAFQMEKLEFIFFLPI